MNELWQSDESPSFLQMPRVVISLGAWQKIMAYAMAVHTEINGFAHIRRVGNTLHIRDPFILKQTASMGHTETDPLDLAVHIDGMLQASENPATLRVQWHSHIDMPAYFSETDMASIEDTMGDWLLSLVVNRYGEFSCRLDILRPFRFGGVVPMSIDYGKPPVRLRMECRQEARAKVRRQFMPPREEWSNGADHNRLLRPDRDLRPRWLRLAGASHWPWRDR